MVTIKNEFFITNVLISALFYRNECIGQIIDRLELIRTKNINFLNLFNKFVTGKTRSINVNANWENKSSEIEMKQQKIVFVCFRKS
jgi:hypothetical protein